MLAASAQPIVAEIYKRGTVKGRTGKIYQLQSAIDAIEGSFISQLIDGDQTIHDTLEIGCAYGLSSLHICLATKGRSNASHTMIDPFQCTQWDGAGVVNLEQAGIDFFHLIEAKSEFALPRLLESNRQFDFIFVDGMHTFDHAMLDCFYATRLLQSEVTLLSMTPTSTRCAASFRFSQTIPATAYMGR